MTGGFDQQPKAEIHAMAHITGGGLPEKLSRALKPSQLGAELYNPFEPCYLMTYLQKIGKITDYNAYKAWNMGQGMVIITPEPENVIKIARKYDLNSQVIGNVVRDQKIIIKSKGAFAKQNEFLEYQLN